MNHEGGRSPTHQLTNSPTWPPGSLRDPGAILLISCYELGHQPLGAALPLAFLERAGFRPAALDVAVEPFDAEKVARARFVGIAVPMHTALRLGVHVAERVREINPGALICFYGLYAALNADYLLDHGGDFCIGGEYEEALLGLARIVDCGLRSAERGQTTDDGRPTTDGSSSSAVCRLPSAVPTPQSATRNPQSLPPGVIIRGRAAAPVLERLEFGVASRGGLPPLERYARLEYEGEQRVAGYVEASRGCAHLCTHCPIPPVYGGRFFVVPQEVVLEDVRRQVRAGARHITFGDPDFLNGPTHSLRIVRAMRAECPQLTWDFTAKVEHILERRHLFPEFGALGCLFVVSAVESLSERVLAILEKHHTRADVEEALAITRAAGIALRPTWVAFTPWTTREDYLEVLCFVAEHNLVDQVDPVQYTIRLLIPPGSLLLRHPAAQSHLGPLDHAAFTYRWAHPDPAMDCLHAEVSARVEQDARAGEDAAITFERIWGLAAGTQPPPRRTRARKRAPRLTEPWFC
jgi:radical SAM superfamily enzyme YgiQ (UPF0313 family)